LNVEFPLRLMMGTRDRKSHPWAEELPSIDWIHSGSVGLRVARILNGEADLYVHLSGKLKVWDTAGPVALAAAGGLEVGVLNQTDLLFDLKELTHPCPIAIGRKGTVAWSTIHINPRLAALK
jgi:3'(2'), 5'-bisphosphate nucleotidase